MKQGKPIQQTYSLCQKILLKHAVLWSGNNWDQVPLHCLWGDICHPKNRIYQFSADSPPKDCISKVNCFTFGTCGSKKHITNCSNPFSPFMKTGRPRILPTLSWKTLPDGTGLEGSSTMMHCSANRSWKGMSIARKNFCMGGPHNMYSGIPGSVTCAFR